MSFNAFKYVQELRSVGVPDKQAEAQIKILNEVIESELATKRDLKELEAALKKDMVITMGSFSALILGSLIALAKRGLLAA